MKKFQTVLLKVWQEACRHIEIGEMTQNIAPMLLQDMPIDQILIRIIDPGNACLETVALGFPDTQHIQPITRNDCPNKDLKKLLKWYAQGKVLNCSVESQLESHLRAILPAEVNRDIVAAPLGSQDGCKGIIVIIAGPNQSFNHRHITLTRVLLEPFSVALENDRRLHELAVLKEAAEADKFTLLKRLGRKELVDQIVGANSGLHSVMERVKLVAPLNVPVLILGETGSGKELIAREIHNRSPRASGAFIRVNCGAIPAELIDSQLFGHEKGAFTGATDTRKGWFERADGGTLFLDEIGELPAAAQVRLLRIMQDGWLERVGGQKSIHVDVRVVAATHCDLAANVANNKFREDLWYRIAVFPIRLPALRERREDIPDIARHFAERAAMHFGLNLVMPTSEDLNILSSYNWPGNVRELAAVIDRAAILGNGIGLEVATALGLADTPVFSHAEDSKSMEPHLPTGIIPLEDAVRKQIEAALSVTKGRVEGIDGAAALLKVNPSTLRAKMRKFKIDWHMFNTDLAADVVARRKKSQRNQ